MTQQDRRLTSADGSDDADARADAVVSRTVARHGAPTVEDYRAVYISAGLPWPGDEEIRRIQPVADAA
ncbi:hypothetical protein AD006_28690 (plasmid) [Pseudonocardia sp. EC080610-09]|uniref:hypothetical protein n=1 Tax=unclassified Pseudonocardia TaxID=2619320 RepID=UPI000705D4E7|nr:MULTISPECIES: hypothetical protein [unclassified Pseudonocardia]ALL79298.1 hypothetical protein AD006_28690 [Pseudonocardia sp. EC080610-09]ALL85268.1 hypothetical protein AD017_29080 [Pseudonocardia sp. EC080619-01]